MLSSQQQAAADALREGDTEQASVALLQESKG